MKRCFFGDQEYLVVRITEKIRGAFKILEPDEDWTTHANTKRLKHLNVYGYKAEIFKSNVRWDNLRVITLDESNDVNIPPIKWSIFPKLMKINNIWDEFYTQRVLEGNRKRFHAAVILHLCIRERYNCDPFLIRYICEFLFKLKNFI
jgi:hypothetical protein